ncbi:protein hu-li tai shao isoform X5 [Musca domestica]|uniref:Protein hu-li tai shao isoform X5 n=1 Tax=Musca domestica TaxID=7370 RepID=A0ABM3V8Q5_MUSDO|nr:protein hu-li tai shao isoform X5 [Musca domestica]
MTEVEQPPQNGIDLSANEDDDNSKARPADIEQDMREMERRKRVEAIMGSKLFREELERIVDSARDSGNADGILQQLSDIVGVPATRVGSVFRASNCMQPINDIRGVESMGYAKGEKILRCKLAATFRLLDLYGWTQGLGAQITARLKVDQEYFLVNPYGLLYHEITASSLNKVDMQGNIVEQGTTNFGVNKSHFVLHSIVHAARPDIRCIIYIGCSPVVAISSLKAGLLPLTKDACVLGEITSHAYAGCLVDQDEREKLVRNLGPNSKVMLLTNHGALCCGETIEEAFFAACHIVQACETQLKLLPVGLDNLVLIPEESRKTIYEQSRSPPEDLAKKFAAAAAVTTAGDSNKAAEEEDKKEGEEKSATTKVLGQTPKWRVGGAEFEALMRMLDNAGYRTGYIYRHPLIKSEPPKPKNDVELPPAVSSLGYLLEEEELFRQGIWKKGVAGKGGDRSRWLNSPNVYQKVEVLETGTPDPKKITKWVAEGSPTHSTPVRIDDPLQFVPVNTNPKEFKRVQQQIKDNRRADKISAGPQSHILEGVTWDEANRLKDATVSQTGDHVVLMGAASKGIIQRGFQHNATVYKAPYAKNPFDNVTDDELNEYKRTVERKKKSIHGEYTDTDFSESEALSSLQTSGAQQQTKQNTTTTTTTAAVSQSEPEDVSEHQVMRIETQQAPVPSQPEVVLSDATLSFINGERSHTATNRKPPTGRGENVQNGDHSEAHLSTFSHSSKEDISTDGSPKKDKKKKKGLRTPSFLKKKKEKKKAEA